MGRKPAPYSRQGWYVSSFGGKQHQKLCRESEGFELARTRLANLVTAQSPKATAPPKANSTDGSYAELHLTWFNMLRSGHAFATPIYEDWFNSFAAFKEWALCNGYRGGFTIQRRNTAIGYFPDNCMWARNNGDIGKSFQLPRHDFALPNETRMAFDSPTFDEGVHRHVFQDVYGCY